MASASINEKYQKNKIFFGRKKSDGGRNRVGELNELRRKKKWFSLHVGSALHLD